MFVKLIVIRGRPHVLASFAEGRIALADYAEKRMVRCFDLPENCYDAVDVSLNGRRMATGYWYTKVVDIWDIDSGTHLRRLPARQTSRLLLDSEGEYVAIGSHRGRAIQHISSNDRKRLLRMGDLYGAYVDGRSNTMWLPINVPRCIGKGQFRPLRVEMVEFPFDGIVWTIRWSPLYDRVIIMQDTGRITCLGDVGGSVLWTRTYYGDETTSNAAYSADGRFFALNLIEKKCVEVLDAYSGETLGRIDVRMDPAYPLSEALVMASDGRILDLASFEVNDGVSGQKWWREAGVERIVHG